MIILKEANSVKDVKWYRKPTVGDLQGIKNSYRVKDVPKEVNEDDRFDFKDWKTFVTTTNDNYPQYFIAYCRKEDEIFIVDTQGFNYPRYVAYLEDQI